MQHSTKAALILCWVAMAATASAQTDKKQLVPIDHVVATVNDSAILLSTLQETVKGLIRVRQAERGRPLPQAEIMQLANEAREKLIDEHCMAQAAKTLGILPPARVEELVQERLKDATQDQLRQFGGELGFTKELKESGGSWQSFVRDERLKILSGLTEQLAVLSRLQNQKNLFITPRMMRDWYQQNRQRYVHGPKALVSWVGFLVDGNREEMLTKANAAAEAWRKEPLTSAEVGKRFFPHARPQLDLAVGDEAQESIQPFVREFGLSHPVGSVEVIAQEKAIWVLRVQDMREKSDRPFEDAGVQADIRRELELDVMLKLRADAVKRSRDRTYIWRSGQ